MESLNASPKKELAVLRPLAAAVRAKLHNRVTDAIPTYRPKSARHLGALEMLVDLHVKNRIRPDNTCQVESNICSGKDDRIRTCDIRFWRPTL